MKKEIDIPEDMDKLITDFINSHTKFNNLNEFAIAAFEYFLINDEHLRSKISTLE